MCPQRDRCTEPIVFLAHHFLHQFAAFFMMAHMIFKGGNEHFVDVTGSNQRLFDDIAHTAKRERKCCIRNSRRARPGLLDDNSPNSNGESNRAVNHLCGDPSLLSVAHDLK